MTRVAIFFLKVLYFVCPVLAIGSVIWYIIGDVGIWVTLFFWVFGFIGMSSGSLANRLADQHSAALLQTHASAGTVEPSSTPARPHAGESPTVDAFRRKIGQEMVNNLNRHALEQQAEQEAGAPFTVLVDDNFHYQDVDKRYELGKFDTLTAALQACRAIVDDGLADDLRQHPGVTAAELYDRYTSFGEDPFIRPAVALQTPVLFSAWDYAKRRCAELTSARPAGGKVIVG